METDESSGSRQWPLFLWGFSWPSVSPGTSRPEPSHRAEARTQHVGLSNQQTWEQGSEQFFFALQRQTRAGGGADSMKQHDSPCLAEEATHSQRDAKRWGDPVRRWGGGGTRHPEVFCQDPQGMRSQFWPRLSWEGAKGKDPAEFLAGSPWSRTIAKDKGRPEKHSDLQ